VKCTIRDRNVGDALKILSYFSVYVTERKCHETCCDDFPYFRYSNDRAGLEKLDRCISEGIAL
jgi:hypothetical protein